MDKLIAICIGGQERCISNPVGPNVNPESIVRNALTILIIVAVTFTIIFILWHGIRYILSRGEKQQVAGARNGITYALIGLVVVFLSFFIISVIGYLFGVNLFFDEGSGIEAPRPTATPKTFDCPDGTDNYYCHRDAPNDAYGPCPICSPNPQCTVGEYSIARCSQGSGCYGDETCRGYCSGGKRPVSYCDGYSELNPDKPGVCVTNCVDDGNTNNPGDNQ